MPFVKLDCGILNSTLWFERTARDLFITALLMAEPFDTPDPLPQIAANSLEFTGWSVPPGWYGFIHAANVGIIHRAKLEVTEETRAALASLGEPEVGSRSQEFDGRRLVRVDGGFIVLNFIKYRDKDATTADRSKRWRERQKAKQTTRVTDTPTRVIRHQAEAEAEAEAEVIKPKPVYTPPETGNLPKHLDEEWERFKAAYPAKRRSSGHMAQLRFIAACDKVGPTLLLAQLEKHKQSEDWKKGMIPGLEKWLEKELWIQEPETPQTNHNAALAHLKELDRRKAEKS